jgi:hypothetical protein
MICDRILDKASTTSLVDNLTERKTRLPQKDIITALSIFGRVAFPFLKFGAFRVQTGKK